MFNRPGYASFSPFIFSPGGPQQCPQTSEGSLTGAYSIFLVPVRHYGIHCYVTADTSVLAERARSLSNDEAVCVKSSSRFSPIYNFFKVHLALLEICLIQGSSPGPTFFAPLQISHSFLFESPPVQHVCFFPIPIPRTGMHVCDYQCLSQSRRSTQGPR